MKDKLEVSKVHVRETDMADGNDVIWKWPSARAAVRSGRLDYVIERGLFTKGQLMSCSSVNELVDLVGFPFSVENQNVK